MLTFLGCEFKDYLALQGELAFFSGDNSRALAQFPRPLGRSNKSAKALMFHAAYSISSGLKGRAIEGALIEKSKILELTGR